jgi:hypothetical protein
MVFCINNSLSMDEIQKSDVVTNVGLLDMNLNDLLALPECCVYALVNEVDRKCQVFSTSSLLKHLGGLIDDIRISGEWQSIQGDIQKVQVRILEVLKDEKNMRFHQSQWIKRLNEEGYKNYKDISPVSYKVDIVLGFRHGNLQYMVYLMNKRKDRKLIGLFTKKKEMNEFLHSHYPNGVVTSIITHSSVK